MQRKYFQSVSPCRWWFCQSSSARTRRNLNHHFGRLHLSQWDLGNVNKERPFNKTIELLREDCTEKKKIAKQMEQSYHLHLFKVFLKWNFPWRAASLCWAVIMFSSTCHKKTKAMFFVCLKKNKKNSKTTTITIISSRKKKKKKINEQLTIRNKQDNYRNCTRRNPRIVPLSLSPSNDNLKKPRGKIWPRDTTD